MRLLSLSMLISAVILISCKNNNPSSTQDITFSDIQGSWLTVQIHEYGTNVENGVKDTWDTTYLTPIEHENTEMWKFTGEMAICYYKDGGNCFYKSDSEYVAFNGDRLVGDSWSGEEGEYGAGFIEEFKWYYAVRKTNSGLVLSYVEDETSQYVGENYTSHEVWEYSLEMRDGEYALDSLANSIIGCEMLKIRTQDLKKGLRKAGGIRGYPKNIVKHAQGPRH